MPHPKHVSGTNPAQSSHPLRPLRSAISKPLTRRYPESFFNVSPGTHGSFLGTFDLPTFHFYRASQGYVISGISAPAESRIEQVQLLLEKARRLRSLVYGHAPTSVLPSKPSVAPSHHGYCTGTAEHPSFRYFQSSRGYLISGICASWESRFEQSKVFLDEARRFRMSVDGPTASWQSKPRMSWASGGLDEDEGFVLRTPYEKAFRFSRSTRGFVIANITSPGVFSSERSQALLDEARQLKFILDRHFF